MNKTLIGDYLIILKQMSFRLLRQVCIY